MLKMRIAVLVSGGGTNLQTLIDAEKNDSIKSGTISLVVSSKEGVYALERAEMAGIPWVTVSRRESSSQADFEAKIQSALEGAAIDLVVLAGFMSILSADFVRRWQKRIINVHPSLIPSFCGEGYYGLRVHEAALKKGVKVTGATIHFVNEIPDGGEIIFQRAVPVYKNDTPETLQRRVMECAEWRLLPKAVEWVAKKILVEGDQYGKQGK